MSQSKDDGGPAFPTEPNTQPGFYRHHGMSLRDWFAGQALAGMLSDGGTQAIVSRLAREGGVRSVDYMANAAYDFAGAMLAERSKP